MSTIRVLAEPIHSDRDLPPFDRVAMDGYALETGFGDRGIEKFQVIGRAFAGEPQKVLEQNPDIQANPNLGRMPRGIKVMTGCTLPLGCDRVVRVEDVHWEKGEDFATIKEGVQIKMGQNVHRQGADAIAGKVVLHPGQLLGPAELAVAASVGATHMTLSKLPRIHLLCTGHELVEPSEIPQDHQIRASHPALLASLLSPYSEVFLSQRIPDHAETLEKAVRASLQDCDMLLLTGGVSMGEADQVPEVLRKCGVKEIFHKVKQKPGKPLWFGVTHATGEGQEGKPVFGLPGNPMSVAMTALRYVRPMLRRSLGLPPENPEWISLSHSLRSGPKGFSLFVPVNLKSNDQEKKWVAEAVSHQGSGDFVALSGCAGFLELPPTEAPLYDAGQIGRLWRWKSD